MWLGAFTGILALGLTWFGNLHLAVIVASLISLSMLGASVLPGTRWIDPEFDHKPRRLAPQLRLSLACLALLAAAELLAAW